MQGLSYFVATEDKINYLNLLLQVGFDTLDFGSFVSPQAIPQMADTAKVLKKLDLSNSPTKLLAIVANLRGVEEAIKHNAITYLGYPFSVSETFQTRNTNSDIKTSLSVVEKLLEKCRDSNKQAVIYLSMAFGNPYQEVWDEEIVINRTRDLVERGVSTIALSDTVGAATPESISKLYKIISLSFPETEIGVHLHSKPDGWRDKINAAYESGCRRFDTALKGYGGCPMATDTLTGNIATENLLAYLTEKNEFTGLKMQAFQEAMDFSARIFRQA
ncbi:MAG: hydroxymethylglutaryl-CoA lyase [Sphingobacteriaceae bacterium]|nr:hydroxymethylglutaryl-CoA lyase [Sphingobacteriaceae bacterium]